MRFAYAGRTRAGVSVRGERVAETAEAVAAALRREQVLATKIVPVRVRRPRTVGRKNVAIFTRQFSAMIDAGLPLVQCLELLAREEPDERLAAAIDRVRADVEAGASLADALERAAARLRRALHAHGLGRGGRRDPGRDSPAAGGPYREAGKAGITGALGHGLPGGRA